MKKNNSSSNFTTMPKLTLQEQQDLMQLVNTTPTKLPTMHTKAKYDKKRNTVGVPQKVLDIQQAFVGLRNRYNVHEINSEDFVKTKESLKNALVLVLLKEDKVYQVMLHHDSVDSTEATQCLFSTERRAKLAMESWMEQRKIGKVESQSTGTGRSLFAVETHPRNLRTEALENIDKSLTSARLTQLYF